MEQNMDKVNSMEQNVDKASKPQGLAELSPGSPALPPTPTDEIKGLSIAVKPARVASNKQKKRRNLYSTAPDAPVAKRRERERPSQNGAKKRTRKQDIASDVKALWLVDNLNIDQDPRSQVELSPQALSRALVGRSVYGYQGSFCHRLGKRTLKPHQRKKALLVDDITVTVHLTLHSLHRAGFEDVDTATNGRMAVTMATKREYDIILMDIKLPVISGIEATKEIRAFENKLHRQPSFIVALTGSVSKEDLDAYKEVGMNGCIEKGCVVTRAMQYFASQKFKPGIDFMFINPLTSLIADLPESRSPHFNPTSSHFRHEVQLPKLDDPESTLPSTSTSITFIHITPPPVITT